MARLANIKNKIVKGNILMDNDRRFHHKQLTAQRSQQEFNLCSSGCAQALAIVACQLCTGAGVVAPLDQKRSRKIGGASQTFVSLRQLDRSMADSSFSVQLQCLSA